MAQTSLIHAIMSATQYALHLKGFVGGADFDRNYVDFVLSKYEGKAVNVLIDSLGGSVATALSIASAFRNHGDVTVHFVGMNASAATIASLGAKHISIDANAMYLVHKCSSAFFEWGSLNADQFTTLIADCEKIKADLDKLDLNIASMYSAKCKKEPKALLDLMQKGGWLSAKDALDWGFVDEITDLPEEAAPKLTDAVASEMAAAGMPIPNIPVADNTSAFGRFLASLASLFRPSTSNSANSNSNPDNEMTNENPTPEPTATAEPAENTARVAELEATLAERDAKITELSAQIGTLTAEVAALKQKPGDESKQVVDDCKTITNTEDPLVQYHANVKESRELFNSLP